MGWTHNWRRQTELPRDRFKAAVEQIKFVLERSSVELAGADGTGEPIFRSDQIVFNGCNGQGCEPFEIARQEFDRHGRKEVWSFCKTERMPYDICVQAALVILQHHLGTLLEVGSDGGDEDWRAAKELVKTHLGYGDDFRLQQAQ